MTSCTRLVNPLKHVVTKQWTLAPAPRVSAVPSPSASPSVSAPTEGAAVPWWLWPQVLSLDAPVVLVLWQMALAHTHRVHLPSAFHWGLALVTWLVYTLDRTVDAVSGRLEPPASQRHAFYFRHCKLMFWLVLPAGALAVLWVALTCMPAGLLWSGLGMAMLGTVYLAYFAADRQSATHRLLMILALLIGQVLILGLALDNSFKLVLSCTLMAVILVATLGRFDPRWSFLLPKELFAAFLLALGCVIGVHFWVQEEHFFLCVETVLVTGLFLLNLVSIVSSERLAGAQAGLARRRYSHLWLGGLLLGAASWTAFDTLHHHGAPGVVAAAVVVAVSALLHLGLHGFAHRLRPELFHVLADLMLVVPLPLLFWVLPG